jgi:hypothetical protein
MGDRQENDHFAVDVLVPHSPIYFLVGRTLTELLDLNVYAEACAAAQYSLWAR